MSITISLNEKLARRLTDEANALRTSVEDVANRLLERVFPPDTEDDGELNALVARICATPPDYSAIRPAIVPEHSLLLPCDEVDFDLAEWSRQWEAIEAEMKAR